MNRAGARIKNCTRNPSPARVKRDFTCFAVSKIELKSQRATFRSRHAHLSSAERHRRSNSGAAVRLTRGSALGRGLGCAFATRRGARAEASDRGGPQLAMLVLGPAGFNPPKPRTIARLSEPPALSPRRQAEHERIGASSWSCFCGSSIRAVRRHSTRRAATRRSSLLLSAGGELL